MVQSQRRLGDLTTTETRYFISSLSPCAHALPGAARGLWSVENILHWILDIAFREDDSRIRTGQAAHNRAVLRRLPLNLLSQEPTAKGSIAAKRKQAGDPRVGRDENHLLQVLRQ